MFGKKRFALSTAILFLAIGLFVFLLYFYFFVPFSDAIQILQKANPLYLLLAFGSVLVSAAFYSLTWQRLLGLLTVKASFRKTFEFTWIATFVDILVPFESVSGDISRIYLMSKESNANAGKVAASVVSHRILSTSVTIISLMISTTYFAFKYKPPALILDLVIVIGVGCAIFLGLLFYVSMRKEATRRIVDWIISVLTWLSRGRWQFVKIREWTMNTLVKFHEGFLILGENPKGLLMPLLYSILAWFLDILIAILVFLSLGSIENTISLSAIIIVYSLAVTISSIPLISGELGILEIAMTSLFMLLGNPQTIAIFAVATLLIRMLTLWVRVFVGGLFVQLLGIKNLMSSFGSMK
jgi:uncharacterized protein (TIRG00374 family)